ncbi:MAG: glycosyltransferase [Bacteroidetes bacterium]|nr:glycosyltransferase [Bacteroidota bacterium]
MFQTYFSELLLYIILIVFLTATAVQLIYFWFFYSRLAFSRLPSPKDQQLPVSVVVCARNEYENLVIFLPLILEQNYPDFEVVVVNDASDDESIYLLRDFAEKYPNLKIVDLPQSLNFFKGKKFPLSIGIKSAKNEIILLTDADCRPASKDWINVMQLRYDDPDTEIVLGYGGYERSGGILNRLIRFDTLRVAMSYLSFALAGLPYMGVGRNLSYRKSLFYRNNGFISHYQIPSGDDDLFINQVAKSANTHIQIAKEAHTISIPKKSWTTWVRQKRRHLSTSNQYKWYHKLLLAIYPLTEGLFFAGFLFLAITFYLPLCVFPAFALRLISSLIVYKGVMKRLNEKNFLFITPFLEIFFLIFNIFTYLTRKMNPSKNWK